jgi:hypothetical protein
MAVIGTSLTSRDVRLESAKQANADIEQIAVAIVIYEYTPRNAGHQWDLLGCVPLRES